MREKLLDNRNYDNELTLLHFVEQCDKANMLIEESQRLVAESEEFYRNFLLSKLVVLPNISDVAKTPYLSVFYSALKHIYTFVLKDRNAIQPPPIESITGDIYCIHFNNELFFICPTTFKIKPKVYIEEGYLVCEDSFSIPTGLLSDDKEVFFIAKLRLRFNVHTNNLESFESYIYRHIDGCRIDSNLIYHNELSE